MRTEPNGSVLETADEIDVSAVVKAPNPRQTSMRLSAQRPRHFAVKRVDDRSVSG